MAKKKTKFASAWEATLIDSTRIEGRRLVIWYRMARRMSDAPLVESSEQLRTEVELPAVPMLLWCPMCGTRHIDEGEFAEKLHHTHSCQNPECGMTWRPAVVYTVGVKTLPGFLNKPAVPPSMMWEELKEMLKKNPQALARML